MSKKCEKKKEKNLMNMNKSLVISRGRKWGKVEEHMGEINGDGKRLDLRW